jgi:hypothetical protein
MSDMYFNGVGEGLADIAQSHRTASLCKQSNKYYSGQGWNRGHFPVSPITHLGSQPLPPTPSSKPADVMSTAICLTRLEVFRNPGSSCFLNLINLRQHVNYSAQTCAF